MSKKFVSVLAGAAMSFALAAVPASAGQYAGGYGYGMPNQVMQVDYYGDCRGNESEVALGTILGAIAGGAIGNQFGRGSGRTAATVAGVLIGGFAGNRIARGLSCEDQYYAQETYYDAYENGDPGQTYNWNNPETGNYGYVTPAEYYENDEGYNCREFTQTIYIDGRRQTAVGTACQNPDGTWYIVN